MPKKLSILGSTGSIGRQTLDVVRSLGSEIGITALTGHSNIGLLVEQALEFKPGLLVTGSEAHYALLCEMVSQARLDTRVMCGPEGLLAAATLPETDMVMSAIVGSAGLQPSLAVLESGKNLLLANKETLVAGGALVMKAAETHGTTIIPVDSEHSAIFQCLQGQSPGSVSGLILTASGGPFRGRDLDFLNTVTPAQALKHPKWTMGSKITIDSATLMNKGLEVIEAHWLFKADYANINVVVHPESAIHSMIEFVDGSILAQMGVPDMRLPIQYALTYPARVGAVRERLDLLELASMHFDKPDTSAFPCLDMAYSVGKAGGLLPAAMNAANEIAVESFLKSEIAFNAIPKIIGSVLDSLGSPGVLSSVDDVIQTDSWARARAREIIGTQRR